MLKSKITVQVPQAGTLAEDTILLGDAYVKQYKLPPGHPVTLKFGSFRTTVRISSGGKGDVMKIGASLARQMGIPGGAVLRSSYKQSSSTLSLGPLIGVLISRDYPQQTDRPFGAITMFCRELVDACAAQGASVYFLTPDAAVSGSRIEGWIYNGGWRKTSMPVPDVVNNRLTARKLENRPSVQQFFKEAKSRYGTQVFNEKFLDKNEVFGALGHESSLAKYLPDSRLLRSYADLKSMAARHPVLFLKPERGSLGKGIIRVSKLEGESVLATYTAPAGIRRQSYPSLAKLYSSLGGKLKTVRYQLQQGLTLIDIGKRPVDFRALVQKNHSGSWALTSIVARTAGSNHFVSNLARGGTLSRVKEAVARSNLAPGYKAGAGSKLQKAALDIAQGIDARIPAHFGELGIDLALDTGGRVWLLEVNSKPSKNDNTPLNEGKIRPSVRNMIQYSRYLAGF
ncbi:MULTISPECIES: YheC/YheD family protein [unclassified Paenibacillus]|uniref:YheC/YheD family endospore coat-associated protein n=1 Tax=unclassified Paenibacillus TaxID=185978 RepID=UPI0009540DFD|nr:MULTISPECIES: YheC/YheD family protein [unclassified Paenibacillus]ASS66446.1 YheC/YheD family protein [Paenibacillus sp. RUD330]SIQ04109.1 YheC/D like ATP-grasp [Paenibacillus sp. RU4X]SIQ24043.1 YheC/D like ATP-grasp [Paenibacillus sp. RU4T]